MFKRHLVAAVLSATFAIPALAASAAEALPPLPAALKFAQTNAGLTVIKPFDATSGLQGWVVKDQNSGKHIVVYTTQDGEVLIAGMALDKTGRNLTALYAEEHVPAPDYSPAFNDFTGSAAASVMVGSSKAPAEITVLHDPNCTFCKLLSRLTRPAVEAGELRIRYVPVAILGGDSAAKAAAILAAKDPGAVLYAQVDGASTVSNDAALQTKVTANSNLMRKHGFNGTPTVLYKSKAGGQDTMHIANGLPNMLELFTKLGISGQTDKLKSDPALAKYLR